MYQVKCPYPDERLNFNQQWLLIVSPLQKMTTKLKINIYREATNAQNQDNDNELPSGTRKKQQQKKTTTMYRYRSGIALILEFLTGMYRHHYIVIRGSQNLNKYTPFLSPLSV